ncbi:MAG TPA: gamma-glutamyltransferase [Tepidisphaeraceae bacterium]|jgi:gamma-glutamyltranspeptidase/glutathione hydrolase
MVVTPAAVATPHPQATLAARDILLDGGNAFDAAVAAMLALCTVQSHQVGLGGYGGNLVAYVARERKVIAIDFDSRAPHAFRPELFQSLPDRMLGYRAITAPAVLAGLDLVLKTRGTKTWKQVTRRAIEIAEEGFATDEASARFLAAWEQKTDAESRKHFFPNGNVPRAGERWVQKDLARLLRRIGAEGIDSFYRGDIARHIVSHIRAHGGIISERDFDQSLARATEPVTTSYRGHELNVPPPPAGGLTTLQILKVLEHFELAKTERWGSNYFHLFAQAALLCWKDRARALGDPDVVKIPVEELLSPANIQAKVREMSGGLPAHPPQSRDRMNHTANVTITDSQGNVVSMTATQGFVFGSQVVIPETGLVMNHGMSRFDYGNPDLPNAPAPGKRMHHNMAPTIVLRDGQPRFAFGLPGGSKIITVTAQLAINFIDFAMTPEQCVFSPRVHTETGEPLSVSSAVTDATIAELEQMGHRVVRGQTVGGPKDQIAGCASALMIDPYGGRPTVASQAAREAAMVLDE